MLVFFGHNKQLNLIYFPFVKRFLDPNWQTLKWGKEAFAKLLSVCAGGGVCEFWFLQGPLHGQCKGKDVYKTGLGTPCDFGKHGSWLPCTRHSIKNWPRIYSTDISLQPESLQAFLSHLANSFSFHHLLTTIIRLWSRSPSETCFMWTQPPSSRVMITFYDKLILSFWCQNLWAFSIWWINSTTDPPWTLTSMSDWALDAEDQSLVWGHKGSATEHGRPSLSAAFPCPVPQNAHLHADTPTRSHTNNGDVPDPPSSYNVSPNTPKGPWSQDSNTWALLSPASKD